MEKPIKHIVSLSGGKDSTAMLLRMLEEGWPVDIILFCDTGMEFDAMYRHIEKLEKYTGQSIVRLKSPQSFEYLFYDYSPKRANPKLEQYRGFSWPGPRNRWCTAMLKTRIIAKYLRELSQEYTLVQYIGIAADEPKRIREHRYPLVEWGITDTVIDTIVSITVSAFLFPFCPNYGKKGFFLAFATHLQSVFP